MAKLNNARPRVVEPEIQTNYLTKKAVTPKVLRVNSPDALVANKRINLNSLNSSKIDNMHITNESMNVNTPEWKVRLKSHNSSDEHYEKANVPQFDIFNGKELHAIFTHYKSIVQTTNTFSRIDNQEDHKKTGIRRSHCINSEVINFIIKNLDKDKQDLFYKTWNFRSNSYISWEKFHDRIKTVSFEHLHQR